MRPKRERQAPESPRVMGTRFQPADPDAVRHRFAAIKARAFERVAEEQRLTLARLASEASAERELSDGGIQATESRDDRRGAGVHRGSHAPPAAHD